MLKRGVSRGEASNLTLECKQLPVLMHGSSSSNLPCPSPVRLTLQCWESPNGTNESRGQFPELYIRAL